MMGEFFRGWKRKVGVVTLVMASVLVAGCDPVRTTNQTVSIKLLDRETKAPVSGATVQIKDAWVPNPKDQLEHIDKKNWENFSWHRGSTDSEGRVLIRVVITSLDGTWGRIPPHERDISGRKFLMKITTINGAADELEIKLTPKASGETKKFAVEIDDIGPSNYGE